MLNVDNCFRYNVQNCGGVTSAGGDYVTKTSSLLVVSRRESSTLTSSSRQQRLKPFSEVPGPRGLPLIGTLWDFAKPNGFGFDKMFEVRPNVDLSNE